MNANTALTLPQSQSRLPIERRIMRFDYKDIESPVFHSDNAVVSAYWVGLSSSFPLGEAEFIKSVRLFEDQITDARLKDEVQDFAAQEAHHGLQHKLVNKRFDEVGYKTSHIEKFMVEKLDERVRNWSPEKRLMHTVAAEHFTATMAHYALTHADTLGIEPDSVHNLFLWHAIEEIEHKSVAFDVYLNCVGNRFKLRRHYAFFAFIEFPLNMIAMTRFLLKDRGHKTTWAERKGMWQHLFGKQGLFRACWGQYMSFFKKDFHPWQHDDSALVAEWKEKLAPYFAHQPQ
ncbi:MAG: metal-dependent hydrolase [Gammaproteobacteria bacterium]|nr:metal-dependent hydrolase [Gammaproteobacteria bacterium]